MHLPIVPACWRTGLLLFFCLALIVFAVDNGIRDSEISIALLRRQCNKVVDVIQLMEENVEAEQTGEENAAGKSTAAAANDDESPAVTTTKTDHKGKGGEEDKYAQANTETYKQWIGAYNRTHAEKDSAVGAEGAVQPTAQVIGSKASPVLLRSVALTVKDSQAECLKLGTRKPAVCKLVGTARHASDSTGPPPLLPKPLTGVS